MKKAALFCACAVALSACNFGPNTAGSTPAVARASSTAATALPFVSKAIAQFNEPWAMSFLPDGRLLVSEKKGVLKLLKPGTPASEVSGVPEVDYGGQGGFGDVVVHPDFAENQWVYLSYVEAGENDTRGAAVARAKLTLSDSSGQLSELTVIWRQDPKVSDRGHFAHRIAFGPDKHLWITSGDRQKFTPAQEMSGNLGKILRLNEDGSSPADNPFAEQGGVSGQIWSLGHRNPLGLAFDAQGQLWAHEMGPKGGDEFNLIERAANYGWPLVSNGEHYDDKPIPDHDTDAKFNAPEVTWTPVIAPAGMIIYSGAEFPAWQGNALIGGLASQALVRVEISGTSAREAERFDMGHRIREVEQGPAGDIWLLEDGSEGSGGRLLQLSAKK